MIKRIALVLALLFLPLAFPASVQAGFDPLEDVCEGLSAEEAPSTCQQDGTNPISGSEGVIIRVVNLLSWVIGVASVIVIIYSGIKFATAQGSSEGVGTARTAIIYAAIGLAVAASAQMIIRFVINQA